MTFDQVPHHVAIIMDGNGRWAQQRALPRIQGHIEGVESVRRVVKSAQEMGVEYLTIYAFSTENWGRPTEEVEALMRLLSTATLAEIPALNRFGVHMRFIGDLSVLSPGVREALMQSERATAHNRKMTLLIAVNYSSRWEITRMVKQMAHQLQQGELTLDDITPEVISGHLVTAGVPDPDLLIRTSGECRLSNFLLWQLSYSELYFTDILWPDFDEKAFEDAVANYQQRQRRYGILTE